MTNRPATPADRDALVDMCLALWPDAGREEHAAEIEAHLSGLPRTTLPIEILVAEMSENQLAGFVEVSLRSAADGCDARNRRRQHIWPSA